jgi:pSer/pThr/pTyr-binding forkhead associated (FHA) protein
VLPSPVSPVSPVSLVALVEPTPSGDTPEVTSGGPAAPTRPATLPVLVEPQRPAALPPELGVAHYRFRIGGTIVFLDRAAYIGRNPSRPRVLRDGLPRLVQVPSVSREVSSTHLEIRQRGASVVVTDLRSTNGTIVNIPGGTPTKLRQGESMVVTPGTLIDIGDGNLVEILPLQRR